MDFYNRDNIKFDFTDMEYLSHGYNGEVFYNNKMIFKKYFSWSEKDSRINLQLFDLLKEFKNPHFIELYDIYTKYFKIEIINRIIKKIRNNAFLVEGYSAKYYQEDNIDVLNSSKEYFLENLFEIEKFINELSENGIKINDMIRRNIILNKDNIVIIDPDLFYLWNPISCLPANKEKLYYLFNDLLLGEVFKIPYLYTTSKYLKEQNIFKNHMYNLYANEKFCVTDEFSKILKHTNKPVELFEKTKK